MRHRLDDHSQILIDELAEILRLEEATEALECLGLHLGIVVLS